MAFPGALRGDGLARAHRALLALEENPQQLAHTRDRFSDSPPSYKSQQSHNSTLSHSPSPVCDQQRQREAHRFRLMEEHKASLPYTQFSAQRGEELDRILRASTDGSNSIPIGIGFHKLAHDNVKKQWVEQGIWNDKWNDRAHGLWKHEEPLDIDSESEIEDKSEHISILPRPERLMGDAESEPQRITRPRPILLPFTSKPHPEPHDVGTESDTQREIRFGSIVFSGRGYPSPQPFRQQENTNSNKKKQGIAERRATLKREREASRPFHQFIYQVSRDRERMQSETEDERATTTATLNSDINTKAYENVKAIWVRRKIWNRKWGILPGMVWKHEEPIELLTADPPPVQVDPPQPVNDRADVVESPPHVFNFSRVPPDDADYRQTQSLASMPGRGQSLLNMVNLTNSDADPSLQANTAPHWHGRPPIPRGQFAQSRREISPRPNRYSSPLNRTTLSPVNSSRESKYSSKKQPTLRRRPNHSNKLSAAGPSSLLGADTTQTAPRRSKRLQTHKFGTTNDPGARALTNPVDDVSQSRPKRTSAGKPKTIISAKAQGGSKQKQPRTSDRRTKKAK
ncbi:hypothetical protein EMCG_04572 [[Emmonsia] crescens]|uniref:Uncharacterized protein n=1 Tax=[Emmonsia] crescens TaxID=73230 RepID=A0A0G2HRL6_9EURO|nr:hypothetical protein EMCG_04572 [Emmonsia crescens UAMH 3008]